MGAASGVLGRGRWFASLAGLLSGGVLSGACGEGKVVTVEDPPVPLAYTLAFPSVAVAATTETVKVSVFNGDDPQACQELVLKLASGQSLPKSLAETNELAPCAFANGDPATQVEVPFGAHAILAVGKLEGKRYVVGCTVQGVQPNSPPISISLALTGMLAVPATKCTQLSQKCSNQC